MIFRAIYPCLTKTELCITLVRTTEYTLDTSRSTEYRGSQSAYEDRLFQVRVQRSSCIPTEMRPRPESSFYDDLNSGGAVLRLANNLFVFLVLADVS